MEALSHLEVYSASSSVDKTFIWVNINIGKISAESLSGHFPLVGMCTPVASCKYLQRKHQQSWKRCRIYSCTGLRLQAGRWWCAGCSGSHGAGSQTCQACTETKKIHRIMKYVLTDKCLTKSMIITAVILATVQYLTNKEEHTTLYKINKNVCQTNTIKNKK